MAYSSPEDVINAALTSIGYARLIGDIYEGTPAARVALTYYGQTRDELLAAGGWPFAERQAALVAVGAAAPPSPWGFEYAYPADCLRVRYVRPGPLAGGPRSFDPQPILFQVYNDQTQNPPVLSILSDQAAGVLVYVGKITNPAEWVPGFTKAMIGALAAKLSFGLFKSAEVVKARVELGGLDVAEGMMVDDMSPPMDNAAGAGQQR